ncbi:hypothetical protein [Stenotrophomonas maltophilia]|uniref:hypothetical protein n=1 Tax=Stenotrophomonas maltophilia TaxID=40324 RepID=UPI001312124A|nr:hypothetical protein [Stenotrophomonas maltophilia]MBA0284505.1 hypothetical protein [Stenotrophomonas maltophilia]MBA0323772.1 hypothetical protein [Stenotrophomonas maltophilia]
MESAVWGFIGTIVGALASIGTSWITTRSATYAQREKIQLEWRVRQREFQIKAVTELQEILGEFVRVTGKIRHIDEMRERAGHTGGVLPIGEDLSDAFSQHLRRINVLLARIDDARAQASIQEVRGTAVKISMGMGVDMQTMLQFSTEIECANSALTAYLGSIYSTKLGH